MKASRTKPKLEADEVALARIVGIFGLRGEVRLFLYNRASDWLGNERTVHLLTAEGDRFEAEISARPGAGGRVIGKIDGVDTREAARGWMEAEIVVLREQLPALKDGEWYHHDLVGVEVVTEQGRRLGSLQEIHSACAVDTWVVIGPDGTFYVPNNEETVVSCDIEARRAVVRMQGVASETD
jgi:16S rRNA processing protein RimM